MLRQRENGITQNTQLKGEKKVKNKKKQKSKAMNRKQQ